MPWCGDKFLNQWKSMLFFWCCFMFAYRRFSIVANFYAETLKFTLRKCHKLHVKFYSRSIQNWISYFYFLNLKTFQHESISDVAIFTKILLSWTWSEMAVKSDQISLQLLCSSTNRYSKQRITCILSKNKLLFNLPSRSITRKWKILLSIFFMFSSPSERW